MVKLIDYLINSSQSKRDIKAFALVLILYTPIIFFVYDNSMNRDIPKKSIELKLNIFKEIIKEEIIFKTSPLEEDELYDLDEIMDSEPIKEIIKPIEKIEKIKKKILTQKPKPILQKRKKKKKIKKEKKTIKKRDTKSKYKIKKKYKKIVKKRVISKKNNKKFIRLLKRKISQNKIYPKMAQRRNLTGKVKVRFIIKKSGKVSNISLSGSKLFFKSAKNSINKSFPINTKGVKLPITINLSLVYRLR